MAIYLSIHPSIYEGDGNLPTDSGGDDYLPICLRRGSHLLTHLGEDGGGGHPPTYVDGDG